MSADAYLKWKMNQMRHGAAAVSASLSSKIEQGDLFIYFFNPLGLNKGKRAEILRTQIWTRNVGFS